MLKGEKIPFIVEEGQDQGLGENKHVNMNEVKENEPTNTVTEGKLCIHDDGKKSWA